MPKSNLCDQNFDRQNWIVSIFNAQDSMIGHAVMLIEGLHNKQEETLFVGQYDITAGNDSSTNTNDSSMTATSCASSKSDADDSSTKSLSSEHDSSCGSTAAPQSLIINKIRVYESEQYARDYEQFQRRAKSFTVKRQVAKNIINAIKVDQQRVEDSLQGNAEPITYALLGKDHLFTGSEGGHNCLSYLLEKLEEQDISHGVKKAKPKKLGSGRVKGAMFSSGSNGSTQSKSSASKPSSSFSSFSNSSLS